jgi:hypothetical protein
MPDFLTYRGGLKGYKISSENQQWHQIFILQHIAFIFNGLMHVERAGLKGQCGGRGGLRKPDTRYC